MKSIIPFVLLCLIATTMWSWREQGDPQRTYLQQSLNKPITMCGSVSLGWSDSTRLPPPQILAGLGTDHFPITTSSAKAQQFFDQGLRLVYAFNHWEAIRAFNEAIRLDPDCAMAYWGLALAFGPNLNDTNPMDRERTALEAIQQAKTKSNHITMTEKDAIDALAVRYDGKAYAARDSLNNAYAKAMKKLANRYPNHPNIQALCADAIMNTMPWNYWQRDGLPKHETKIAKLILENLIKKFPDHSGAHHLYIHLVEASRTPEIALASAKFLETSMPGAGHIVHMPAHIYIRTGMYTKSIEANKQAVSVDEQYLSYSDNQGAYRLMYYPHNIDFIAYSAYMGGQSGLGISTALKLAYKGSFSKISTPAFSQYLTVEPMIAFLRFGKWNEILALPDPGREILYAQVMWRFSRGMALIRSGYTKEAKSELMKLDSLNALDTLKSLYISFNPVSTSSEISTNLLRGEILLKEKNWNEAISIFKSAVEKEDLMQYNEPPDWKIPTRHYLGAALLEAGQFLEAEKVYKDDLKVNRDNGWSISGLHQSYLKQNKKADAAFTEKRLGKAWKNADIVVANSRF
ncbi:MAG: hypothetical protein ABI477_13760 [Chryseolinea sp.]